MNRRKFLKNSSLAGFGVTAAAATGATLIGATACNTNSNNNGTAVGSVSKNNSALNNAPFSDPFELNEITVGQLQEQMQSGKTTAKKLTELYLQRIVAIDKNGPSLHSVIEINPDAIAIAEALDQERKNGKLRGPLHGIPVLIKDNINTADKMKTSAGSLALENNIAVKDAFIVEQLRKAGAVLLGKTNLSEWANFRSTRSSSGWSSRGGQTKNPYYLDRSPCGSSSGSGAAVSANLCAVAIGTETDGSVIAPASFCGVVGIKPTVGLLSRSGIIPISATQDTAGAMARTVSDAAILLAALTGVDSNDPITNNSVNKSSNDYTSFLQKDALKGKRIGVEQSFLKGRQESVIALYQAAIETLKKLGATIVPVELTKQTGTLGDAEFTVLLYEFKDGLNKYLATVKQGVKNMNELIEFNKKNAVKAMPYFQQELIEMSNAKGNVDSKEYKEALAKSTSARNMIDSILSSYQLDAIVGTSYGPAATIDLVNGDADPGFYFCPPAAMAGYPHITVPMGAVHGLPVGLSFIASAYKESTIISFAYAFEQATKHRTIPQFKPTLYPI